MCVHVKIYTLQKFWTTQPSSGPSWLWLIVSAYSTVGQVPATEANALCLNVRGIHFYVVVRCLGPFKGRTGSPQFRCYMAHMLGLSFELHRICLKAHKRVGFTNVIFILFIRFWNYSSRISYSVPTSPIHTHVSNTRRVACYKVVIYESWHQGAGKC